MAAAALLFDLDGTIWDSFPWYGQIAAGDDRMLLQQNLRQLHKNGNVVHLFAGCGTSRARFLGICQSRANRLVLYEGVAATLRSLQQRGTALGVVTSLAGWIAEPMIEHARLGEFFDTVVHAGNCRSRKPSPGPLQAAMSRLRVTASAHVFYVGDQPTDAEAARRAGISFAWAAYGYGQIEPAGTTVRLSQFEEVLEL